MAVVRAKEMARKGGKRNDFFFYRLRLTLGHRPSIGIEADSDNRLEHDTSNGGSSNTTLKKTDHMIFPVTWQCSDVRV